MADQPMSAEKVRNMLTENLARVRKASNEYFQMLEKGLSSSQLPSPITPISTGTSCSATSGRRSTSATS